MSHFLCAAILLHFSWLTIKQSKHITQTTEIVTFVLIFLITFSLHLVTFLLISRFPIFFFFFPLTVQTVTWLTLSRYFSLLFTVFSSFSSSFVVSFRDVSVKWFGRWHTRVQLCSVFVTTIGSSLFFEKIGAEWESMSASAVTGGSSVSRQKKTPHQVKV